MSCGCKKVERSALWVPSPEYRQPTEIQFGENIDCYMRRAGNVNGQVDDVGPKPVNRIDNTSLTSDAQARVNEQLKLTPESDRTPTSWTATVNGQPIDQAIPGITFNPSTGAIGGQVVESARGKNYKVMVTASDGQGVIDAREFNFYPKDSSKEETIRFVFPLVGPGARVTCAFGPRTPPARGASSQHKGIDISCAGDVRGDIVAAADGVVKQAGPAKGFGNWIIIDHHDSSGKLVASTLYAHMNEMYVHVGQRVSAGQKIAKEGNAGVGSAAHLHFEVHRGGYKNPVDPMAYLNGKIPVAQNNTAAVDANGNVTQGKPTNFEISNRTNAAMAAGESSANGDCPESVPNTVVDGKPATDPNASSRFSEPISQNTPSSDCKPPGPPPPKAEVEARIREVCRSEGLDAEETNFIVTIAKIESGLNPYAKNPTSSATGLYQFLDGLAARYFNAMGKAPTCENRCNIELATKAMIAFYRKEMLPYWNGFVNSGRTRIANKPIKPTSFSGSSAPFYANLDKGAFLYGLIHHDGVGNAVNGIDKQGVAYWRRKSGTA